MRTVRYDLKYAKHKIVFSETYCHRGKYSRKSLDENQKAMLDDRLKHIEGETWETFMSKGEKSGVTPERKGSKSYKKINEYKSKASSLPSDDYFFHFRVGAASVFRVFGFQYRHEFCITHIDPKGKIHRKSH